MVLACRAVRCFTADSGPSVAKEYIRDNYMCLLLVSCCSIRVRSTCVTGFARTQFSKIGE